MGKLMLMMYVCEECGFKADKLKMCCGRKMVDERYVTKYAKCGCCGK